MAQLTQAPQIQNVLARARTVAVLGAHDEEIRPAHYVPAYLHEAGFDIYPVNPAKLGLVLWGRPVVATLAEIDTPIDIVDVFRPAPSIPAHLPDILGMSPLPRVVWFQLGIRNDLVAAALVGAGVDVIQDRCILVDHQRWFAPDTARRASLRPSDKDRYARLLLDKGAEVAAKLADLLAGKDVRLSEVQGVKGLGDRHKLEDRLRAFLDHLAARRALLASGDPAFGQCAECGEPMTVAELDEMPWATHCPRCAA